MDVSGRATAFTAVLAPSRRPADGVALSRGAAGTLLLRSRATPAAPLRELPALGGRRVVERHCAFTPGTAAVRVGRSGGGGRCCRMPLTPSIGLLLRRRRQWPLGARGLCANTPSAEAAPREFEPSDPARVSEEQLRQLPLRAPVVTVMGHVDHGKTTLLDALRDTNVAGREAGGITQTIRAFRVFCKSPQAQSNNNNNNNNSNASASITFLDTPGHQAFSEMRARGATLTDIAVIVVAADDGVMPQTTEAIQHAQAAKVPMIIAVNKIDKPGADPQRVYRELQQEADVLVEAYGGTVQCVEISALQRQNLNQLEEAILLEAEMLDPQRRASVDAPGEAICVEARIDRGQGPVADCIVKWGSLRVGDVVVADTCWGRVRALFDENGKSISAAVPSQPVSVVGLRRSSDPRANIFSPGTYVYAVENDEAAKKIVEFRLQRQRPAEDVITWANVPGAARLMSKTPIADEPAEPLDFIIRGESRGGVEAVAAAVRNLSTEEQPLRILAQGVGPVNTTDISLAATSKKGRARIIVYQGKVPRPIAADAARERIPIKSYSVIYEILDDLQQLLQQATDAAAAEVVPPVAEVARATVMQVFTIGSAARVAGQSRRVGGCRVSEGTLRRHHRVRVLRGDKVVHDGTLVSLKRFQDDADEIKKGQECGLVVDDFELAQGDVLVAYEPAADGNRRAK
ncbi:hypothetical protein CDCA_CDCA04G1312 [Cyanidium caldarium]|uniref:Translation initiation factor IF-2, chloroplastic n=1 Tax=Cyanidium caldarium TaxID=2771 RepID=A0AAV9ISG8_CYACA|nr:hypothetical protein CDCA_CDCA04G1312 [Cyanidium caldarium]